MVSGCCGLFQKIRGWEQAWGDSLVVSGLFPLVGEVAEFIHQAVPLLVVDLKDLFDSSDNVHDFGAFHNVSYFLFFRKLL